MSAQHAGCRDQKPRPLLSGTTPPFIAALPSSNFVPYLITNQAFAQEPWISNTTLSRYPYRPSSLTYPLLPYTPEPCQEEFPRFLIFYFLQEWQFSGVSRAERGCARPCSRLDSHFLPLLHPFGDLTHQARQNLAQSHRLRHPHVLQSKVADGFHRKWPPGPRCSRPSETPPPPNPHRHKISPSSVT